MSTGPARMRPLSGTATSTGGPSVGRTRARKFCIGTTMSIGGMAGRAYDAAWNPKLSFNDHMERDDRVGAEAVDRFLIGGPEHRRGVIAAPGPAWLPGYDGNRRGTPGTRGRFAIRVAHVGWTSVAALPAKPIVDVLVAVDDVD